MRYHYLTFKVEDIAPMLAPPDPDKPDAYISEDAVSNALRDALAKGYRWIRTDGEWAVFEKATGAHLYTRRKENER